MLRAWLVISVLGCSSPRGQSTVATGSARASNEQTIAEAIAILCVSDWNGELYGRQVLRWIPDSLHHAITNEDVRKLIGSLTSPDVKRPELFDAYLAEVQVSPGPCPFRDRLPDWPRELPIVPAKP